MWSTLATGLPPFFFVVKKIIYSSFFPAEEEGVAPAAARAVRAGRCWLHARCRFRVEGALPVLC
jgi:hypothetical protein